MLSKFYKIFHYILLFLGLLMSSWIIWSRFIRERVIKDIPRELTEYGFWVLLYLCGVYLFIIKNFLKPGKPIPGSEDFITLIYKPLKTLDHAIKYNKYVKGYYYKYMKKFAIFIDIHNNYENAPKTKQIKWIMFLVQVLPRIFLVTFLFMDTFYFHKIEIFYKFILIGAIPFIYRYFKYSTKDIYEHWIQILEMKYDKVLIKIDMIFTEDDEEDEEDDDDEVCAQKRKDLHADFENKEVTVREYVEIMHNNFNNCIFSKDKFLYKGEPHINHQDCIQYEIDKYGNLETMFSNEDFIIIDSLFYELSPRILALKYYHERLFEISECNMIKRSRIIIFCIYLLCWSYVLITSYLYFPTSFDYAMQFFFNFKKYLVNVDNPFSELFWGSQAENLLTQENISNFCKQIIQRIRL
jgi:hypothetical protein